MHQYRPDVGLGIGQWQALEEHAKLLWPMPVSISTWWPSEATIHGFRSSFRDWAEECTGYSSHVVEMALAHAISGAVEKAYRRGDLLEQRRKLMSAWAAFALNRGTR